MVANTHLNDGGTSELWEAVLTYDAAWVAMLPTEHINVLERVEDVYLDEQLSEVTRLTLLGAALLAHKWSEPPTSPAQLLSMLDTLLGAGASGLLWYHGGDEVWLEPALLDEENHPGVAQHLERLVVQGEGGGPARYGWTALHFVDHMSAARATALLAQGADPFASPAPSPHERSGAAAGEAHLVIRRACLPFQAANAVLFSVAQRQHALALCQIGRQIGRQRGLLGFAAVWCELLLSSRVLRSVTPRAAEVGGTA